MAEYPEAKVVLTIRDSQRWYDSVAESIYRLASWPKWMVWLPKIGPFLDMTRRTVWQGFFHGRFTDRQFAIDLFEQHNANVQRVVPADKLLVFSVKDGWEPLCQFLDLPIPDTPFPHVNDRAVMQANVRMLQRASWIIPAVLAGCSSSSFGGSSAEKTERLSNYSAHMAREPRPEGFSCYAD